MFFVKQLRADLLLEPELLGKNLFQRVRSRIIDELEGKCIGKNGYVISIMEVKEEDIEHGLIDIDSGALNVTGKIRYHFRNLMSF
jgi:DNA-directed RNA polymerase II subunit RPB7